MPPPADARRPLGAAPSCAPRPLTPASLELHSGGTASRGTNTTNKDRLNHQLGHSMRRLQAYLCRAGPGTDGRGSASGGRHSTHAAQRLEPHLFLCSAAACWHTPTVRPAPERSRRCLRASSLMHMCNAMLSVQTLFVTGRGTKRGSVECRDHRV